MTFHCDHCHAHFEGKLFDIAREYCRVIYNTPAQPDELDINSADGIGYFCSDACRELGGAAVLARVGISAPEVQPGIEPIECCTMCHGPVDMSDWHVGFTASDFDEDMQPLQTEYLAVLCRVCEPDRFGWATRLTA